MKIRAALLLFLLNFSFTLFAADAYIRVHYWPSKPSVFGHIALEVQNAKGDNVYLSYVMRNNLQQDLSRFGASQVKEFPLLSEDSFDSYSKWWRNGPFWHGNPDYGKDYNFLRFNCAHAVSNALKYLGYDTGLSDNHFALRPKKLWKVVQKLPNSVQGSRHSYSE